MNHPAESCLLDLAFLGTVEPSLTAITRAAPHITPNNLCREDLLTLAAAVNAAQRELEALSLRISPLLNQTSPLNRLSNP